MPIDRDAVAQRLHEFRAKATETIDRVRGAVLGEDRRGWPRRRLEQALDLVLAASHDFKSPLAGMYGWARTLRSSWRQLDDAQRDELLDRLGFELASLSRMLDNVLATARLGVEPAREDVELADAVDAAVREARMLHPDRVISVAAINAPVSVVADRARLGRILANLIDNAMKYSPLEAPVKIRVVGSNREGRVVVQDHGIGMSREEARQIFDAFSRASAARAGAEGLGLGLFLTASFVRDLKGSIELDTTPGRGSTFILRLPLAPSSEGSEG